ncbi:NADH-quinone oxidoreductase subunit M [Auraticoccus monumenti]|uniref:NADH dehydrogenase subunit M n=1 Tax=Auraticoccus monumenti TaxID=675864 RepID=A0A1G6WXN4_9ACTN|nr:NADH-quinone oxidoreductase subunit M [Auraticoccus monumenti]SDD69816.1 NADH dehydrogenase subunit M [Auraticoccus monumenti]
MNWTLTALGLLPLVGALVVVLVGDRLARTVGLVVSLLALALAGWVAAAHLGGTDLGVQVPWIPTIGAWWALDVDGLGLTMVALTVLLTPVVLLASWRAEDRRGGASEGVLAGALGRGRAAGSSSADGNDALGAGPRPGVAATALADRPDVAERETGGEDRPQPRRWGARAFFALVLALEGFALLAFLTTDVLLFFLLFDAILLPMYFLIGAFGGTHRKRAASRFLIFALGGGLIMLASVIGLYVVSARAGAPSFLVADLAALDLGGDLGRWLFAGFFIAFAVKAPMVPVHSWLPDAAEESNPATAALLVGILDKLGTFGMIRFCLGLFPEASLWATPVVLVLALVSIIYGALAAIGSKDLMRLIAFTSISHFGFIVLGIFAWTSQSMTGSILYMLNHGFSTAALFLVVGYLVKRRGSRSVDAFGGVQKVAPVLAGLLLFAGLSSLALPGLSSFVSEFLVLSGTFSRYPAVAAVATLGIVLAALYILIMYQRTMTGPLTEDVRARVGRDLGTRERWSLAPLVLLIIVLGFFPAPVLDVIAPTVTATLEGAGVADPVPPLGQEAN